MSNQLQITGGGKVRNLEGVITGTSGVLSSVPLGAANGVATLDSGGKVPVSQLPSSVVTYLGTWNAATNTPTLVNGTGDAGDMYICNVAGTVNFGAGPVVFVVGDWVLYGSGTWQKSSGQNGTVTSVAASITGSAIGLTGSPITTAGTLAFAFAGTNLQYVNGAGNLTTFPTLITSIGLSMPSAFSVANSPLTANGTIAVTGAGVASQYIRGDGTLADFPSSGGGGSSVSYYLNGGTSQGTIGGVTYYEMSKTAVIGTGVDFTKTGDGFIVAFLTDANDPAQLNIPAGNWNYEIYASMSSNGGTPQMYAELYVYDGTTFTLISTSSNEIIYDGTALNLYTFAMAVPATSLTLTDRLAVKLYATNSGGKTTTIHTQDSHLCQIITTFSTGITALNGLTAQVQYFQVGTSGTDFNISSTTATHTFNIPDASATARGLITTGTQTIAGDKTFTGTSIFRTNNFENAVEIKDNTSYGVNSGSTTINTERALTVSSVGFNFGSTNKQSKFNFTNTDNYAYTFPAATGTIALTSDLTGGTVTSVAATGGTGISITGSPITTSGTITITNTAPDQTVALTASTGISVTGTYPNFTITNTSPSSGGTVTSVAALTIGTTGTDLSSSVANSTTTPVITLNVPTASATNRGALASADWTTFNNKQGTITLTTTGTSGAATFTSNTLNIPQYQGVLTNPVTGTGTTNYLPKFTGASTIGNSLVYDDGTNVGIGTATPAAKIESVSTTSGAGGWFMAGQFTAAQYPMIRLAATTPNKYSGLGNDGDGSLQFFVNGNNGAVGTTAAIINPSGNLGLGVTPSAWSQITAIELSNGVSFGAYNAAAAPNMYITSNAYYNGTNWIYKLSSYAPTLYVQNSLGNYVWHTASTGTAGAAITLTAAMTFFNTGNLVIGTTTDSGYKLDVNGTGRFSGLLTASANSVISSSLSYTYLYIDNPNTNAANRNWALITNANNFGDFAIRQSNSLGGNPITAGTDRLLISNTGAATFSSNLAIGGESNIYGGLSGLYAIQNGNASFYSYALEGGFVGNAYYSSGWKYKTSNYATRYLSSAGTHSFQYTTSGTANASLDWLTALSISTTGAATFSSSVTAQGITNGDGTADTRIVTRPNTPYALGLQNSTTSNIYYLGVTSSAATANFQIYNTYSAASIFSMTYQGAATFSSTVTATSYNRAAAGTGFLNGKYAGAEDTTTTGPIYCIGDSYVPTSTTTNTMYGIGYSYNSFTGYYGPTNTWGMYVVGGGTVGIFLAATGAGYFAGAVTATGFFESSDKRIKTLIEDNYQTKGIGEITPKLYTKNGKVELGYYAQDFVGILDSAISKIDDGMLNLSYREVHTAKIYALEQRIKELESKLN